MFSQEVWLITVSETKFLFLVILRTLSFNDKRVVLVVKVLLPSGSEVDQ